MFQPAGDRPSVKGRGHGHVTNFRILHETAKATEFEFSARFGHEKY